MSKRLDEVEDQIYDQQHEVIRREYGKDAADNANYGWFVDDTDGSVQISTKVYGKGVLVSTGSTKEDIDHEWR